jgi:hypothetical protein
MFKTTEQSLIATIESVVERELTELEKSLLHFAYCHLEMKG